MHPVPNSTLQEKYMYLTTIYSIGTDRITTPFSSFRMHNMSNNLVPSGSFDLGDYFQQTNLIEIPGNVLVIINLSCMVVGSKMFNYSV